MTGGPIGRLKLSSGSGPKSGYIHSVHKEDLLARTGAQLRVLDCVDGLYGLSWLLGHDPLLGEQRLVRFRFFLISL